MAAVIFPQAKMLSSKEPKQGRQKEIENTGLLLYIHVPFCRQKCGYCGFYSVPLNDEELNAYGEALLGEVALHGRRLNKPEIKTIFIGGGTPSLLPGRFLTVLIAALQQHFTFKKKLEFSFEANPESAASEEYLRTLLNIGVNRLSLGVQSLNDEFLRKLGRLHTARDAVKVYNAARRVGFGNVNLDLIWGLPGQRVRHWMAELKEIVQLGPTHLSCYNLTVEPDTPLEELCSQQDIGLPDEGDQSKMYIHGAEFLEYQGYIQYEISNFARMGFQCRHNLGYWDGEDYLGLGPSAVSTVKGKRWSNPFDIKEYVHAVNKGLLGVDPEDLDHDVRTKEMIMLRLRTTRGLSLKEYRKHTGRDFVKEFETMIQALHKHELIRISRGHVRLTKSGMLVSNAILQNLFDAAGLAHI